MPEPPTHRVWRIASDTKTWRADDLSGAGARQSGGRWNAPDHAVLYASTTRALACLETLVHLNAIDLPLNRYLVEFAIPDPVWQAAERHEAADLPVGWDALPPSLTSIDFGTAWLQANRTALLILPSVIVPEEPNVLINPAHPQARRIACRKLRKWTYDARFLRNRQRPAS